MLLVILKDVTQKYMNTNTPEESIDILIFQQLQNEMILKFSLKTLQTTPMKGYLKIFAVLSI